MFPEKLALRMPVFVGPTAEVLFEGVAYSMDPDATPWERSRGSLARVRQ